jgi:hypothetical protein
MVEPPIKRARIDDSMDNDGDDWCWDDLSEDAVLLIGLFVPKTDLVWFRDMDRRSAQSVQSYREPYWDGVRSKLSDKNCAQSAERAMCLENGLSMRAIKYALRAGAWDQVGGWFTPDLDDRLMADAYRGIDMNTEECKDTFRRLSIFVRQRMAVYAIRGDNLRTLMDLFDEREIACKIYERLEHEAARYGHWHIVQWLVKHPSRAFSTVTIKAGAYRYGQLPLLKRLYNTYGVVPPRNMSKLFKCTKSVRPKYSDEFEEWISGVVPRAEHIPGDAAERRVKLGPVGNRANLYPSSIVTNFHYNLYGFDSSE